MRISGLSQQTTNDEEAIPISLLSESTKVGQSEKFLIARRLQQSFFLCLFLLISITVSSTDFRRQGPAARVALVPSPTTRLAPPAETLLQPDVFIPLTPTLPLPVHPRQVPHSDQVRALYFHEGTLTTDRLPAAMALVDATKVNALVVDVRDSGGVVAYKSTVPLAQQIGATYDLLDMDGLLKAATQRNLYLIARIVVSQDPILTDTHPEWAIHDKQGRVWVDNAGAKWLSVYKLETWDYAIALAVEAAQKGFNEINFDYVRFPDQESGIVFPGDDSGVTLRTEVVARGFARARYMIPKTVHISADVFGRVVTHDDQLIGQSLGALSPYVDWICPMVYPSHWSPNDFGLADPDLAPYEIIHYSMTYALDRTKGTHARIRPWLQAFSLRNPYYRPQIQAQIKAVRDVGLTSYLLWNAATTYDPREIQEDV